LPPPSAAGAPSAGSLAPQASTGQFVGLGQEAVADNTRGRGMASSTTHQVPLATGTTNAGPVASQVAQLTCVGQEAISGNARDKGTSSSAPIPALPGPQNGSRRLSRSISRSNTADIGPLSQASGSNIPASLLRRPQAHDKDFPGLSSGSNGEYCTWLSKKNSTFTWRIIIQTD